MHHRKFIFAPLHEFRIFRYNAANDRDSDIPIERSAVGKMGAQRKLDARLFRVKTNGGGRWNYNTLRLLPGRCSKPARCLGHARKGSGGGGGDFSFAEAPDIGKPEKRRPLRPNRRVQPSRLNGHLRPKSNFPLMAGIC